ncbi:MAG: polysaccharide biosynthesis/export family protein [Nitrospiraceae bacterium]
MTANLRQPSILCSLGAMALLSSPVTAGAQITAGAQALGQPSSSIGNSMGAAASEKESLVVTSEYRIGPEDVLEISVWRNSDLSKMVTVRPDGRISLPLIGDIQASGLSPIELTAALTARLKEYLETPTVSVMLQEVNSYSIYVVGQVQRPGRFFLKSKTTLLQAITLAGGFTPKAERNRMVILRWKGGNEVKLNASYQDIVIRDQSDQNVILKPGDTIVVPSETMVLTY